LNSLKIDIGDIGKCNQKRGIRSNIQVNKIAYCCLNLNRLSSNLMRVKRMKEKIFQL